MPWTVPAKRYLNQPADQHLLAWSDLPEIPGGDQASVGNGILLLVKILVPVTISVTNVLAYVGTANGTPTSSQNFAGLYDSSGNLIGTSADQSAAWGSTGLKTMALASGPFTVTGGPNAWVYGALLQNATTGARFYRAGGGVSALPNAGLAASDGLRAGTILTGQTSLPSSITIGSVAASGLVAWMALS